MIKVLEVFGEPILYGGQEAFVFKTIQKMNRKNISFDFLTPYYAHNDYYLNFINKINSNLYVFNLPFKAGKSRFNVINKYNKLLKNNHYDVVHINSGSISILALFTFFAKKNGVKRVIVHSHMAGNEKNYKHKILKKIYSPIFFKKADILLAPSYAAAYWQFSKKVFRQKGQIIKNGIDIEKFMFNPSIRKSVRHRCGYLKNDIVLGNVARLSSEKNPEFLIRLLNYLVLNNFKNYKLLLVGNGEQLSYLKELVRRLQLETFVKFVGNVDNVEDYLQAMDIFIFPSKYEGLGIAAIEAQASGLCVIASDGVPKDIKITPNVSFLKLSDSNQVWIDQIINYSAQSRQYTGSEIRKNGYDIKETATKLEKMYLA